MAISTRSFPSTQFEVLDGNLTTATTLPEDVVVIVGKAYKGPSNVLYSVTSTKDAGLVFGSSSPIIKQMRMALAGGAENVALFRIGGKEASINNAFGVGTSISTVEASSTADSNLKVYVGPEPLAANRDAVIVSRNNTIVYSNVTGAESDRGLIEIDGFSKTGNEFYVGSFYDPVPFNQVLAEAGNRVVVGGVDSATISLPDYVKENASKFGFTVLVNGKRTVKYSLDEDAGKVTLDPSLVSSLTNYTVEVSYINKFTSEEKEEAEFEYVGGRDLINSTWKEYYEAFDTALRELTLVNTRAVVIGDLFNVPNIKDGATEDDRLEYVLVEEQEDSTYSYEWSTTQVIYQKDGTDTTQDIYEADLSNNGEPIVLKRYNTVDFVHRAGMWAYNKTRDDGFYPNVVVGAIGPTAYTPKYINQWIGKLPTYNDSGTLISNGSGLLGHPYMVGNLENGGGGYFATLSGYPDGSTITDSGGAVVDLGKYLSIVVSQVVPSTGGPLEVTSGAAAYAGIIASLKPGDGTTNSLVKGVVNMIDFKVNRLKDFNNIGYVAFLQKTKGLSVLSGTLASRITSDFQYVGTSVVLNRITQDINDICEPFIGRGIDGVLMVALHSALVNKLSQRQLDGYYSKYSMKMTQLGPNIIKVYYKIFAKDELRVVENEITLDRETIEAFN